MSSKLTPLRGIRVIDLTMGWAGPLATRHMADLGAEIIKIESERYFDWWRGADHSPEDIAAGAHERNPAYNHINRNKSGVSIDLSTPRGRDLALNLIACADAVIENQSTGVMDRLGLSYEALCEVNPSIVMLSLPSFGATGPWANYRGYGSTAEQGGGLPHLTGGRDDPPIQHHIAYGDACGGLHAAGTLLVALFHRRRTGVGQRIDVSQVEGMLQLGVHGPIHQALTGTPPPRVGNRHPQFVPHGCFRCAGKDDWLVVALSNDAAWPALAGLIGRVDLAADPSCAQVEGRRARESEIEAAIAAWTRRMTADDAMARLQGIGVAAGVVHRAHDMLESRVFAERGFWRWIERPHVGSKPHPLSPYLINGQRAEIRTPAPLLGEHTRRVLRDVLRLDDGEITSLEADGIIGQPPEATVTTT